MELQTALAAHYAWRQRLRDAAASGTVLDVATIQQDNQCPLGKWLHGEGSDAHGAREEFGTVLDAHAAFHVEAGRLADLVNHHASRSVHDELAGGSTPFANASTAVNMSLIRFFKVIGQL